jgi:nicotinamide mononucleotide transporter
MQSVLAAAQPLLGAAFEIWGSAVTWLEIVAFMLSLWMVVCNMRVDPLAWPLAIAASLLYALLFAASKLYGEASLQLVFVAVSVWGWWQWLRGRSDGGAPLRVHSLSVRHRLIVAALTLLAWPALAQMLARLTDSDVPYLDALPTVGSVAGQLLLGRKLIENWPTWLLVNVFSVGLFAFKSLWLTVLLYAIFAIMSAYGWRAWRRLAVSESTKGRSRVDSTPSGGSGGPLPPLRGRS